MNLKSLNSLVSTIDVDDEDDFLNGFVYEQTTVCKICGSYGGSHFFSCATLNINGDILDLDPIEYEVD